MILISLFISLVSFAHVIQDDVATTEKNPFNFNTVCEKMVTHESPLIEVVSGTEIDCMGKKINVGDFCMKEMEADPYYLRAYVDKDQKQVICHSGKKVLFKYLCTKLEDKILCSTMAKESCERIREKLAKRLHVIHSSFIKNEKGIKQLNCFFESDANPIDLKRSHL